MEIFGSQNINAGIEPHVTCLAAPFQGGAVRLKDIFRGGHSVLVTYEWIDLCCNISQMCLAKNACDLVV